MISTETLSSDWIDKVAQEYGYRDKALLEKAVRALYLLETLIKANSSWKCNFTLPVLFGFLLYSHRLLRTL